MSSLFLHIEKDQCGCLGSIAETLQTEGLEPHGLERVAGA